MKYKFLSLALLISVSSSLSAIEFPRFTVYKDHSADSSLENSKEENNEQPKDESVPKKLYHRVHKCSLGAWNIARKYKFIRCDDIFLGENTLEVLNEVNEALFVELIHNNNKGNIIRNKKLFEVKAHSKRILPQYDCPDNFAAVVYRLSKGKLVFYKAYDKASFLTGVLN